MDAVHVRAGAFITGVRFATETLAGIPSLIIGLFGFLIFVTNFGQGHRFGFSRLAGALTLVILNLPLLLRVSEDAIRSVPNELREASYAVGANKLQTVFKVLVPTSLPALTTGIIPTAGKMLGETAALVFTALGRTRCASLRPRRGGASCRLCVHLATRPSDDAADMLCSTGLRQTSSRSGYGKTRASREQKAPPEATPLRLPH